jgi:hypothetical protein
MGAYLSYVERPKIERYLIVVVFFVLGLMAKPMLVTLPFVLLLLDYWPLQRFQQIKSDQKIRTVVNKPVSGDRQKKISKKRPTAGREIIAEKPADFKFQWALIRPLLWEKMPLFALAALSSIVTYFAQQKGGSIASSEIVPLVFVLRMPSFLIPPTSERWSGRLILLCCIRTRVCCRHGRSSGRLSFW